MMTLEICCHCENPTGRAGAGEDSIYAGDTGPFCPDCRDNFGEILGEIIDKQSRRIGELEPLARIGAAVQPRPISEAPKDGRGLILICGNWNVTGSWHRTQNCWVNNGPIYERIPANEQPTHFIEQSVLPKVKP